MNTKNIYKIITFMGSNNRPEVSSSNALDQKLYLVDTLNRLFFSVIDSFSKRKEKTTKN